MGGITPERVDSAQGTATNFADQLRDFVMAQLPGVQELELRNLHRMAVGLSRENWIFDASWVLDGVRVDESLILRRDPLGSLLHTDRSLEFAVLRALEKSSVPAPRALWIDRAGSRLGRPSLVMRRESGECEYYCLTGDDRPLDVRMALASEFLDTLVNIALTGWRELGLGKLFRDPGLDAANRALDHWENELRQVEREALPEMEVMLAWLRARAPESQSTVLVHGDFKPGNALVRDDHVSVVLDWELAHLGDPVEDLGWITNPVRRREHQIPGEWETEQITAAWSERTGFAVRPDEVRWWNVFANYKLAVISLTGLAEFIDGHMDRPYNVPPFSLCRIMYDLMDI